MFTEYQHVCTLPKQLSRFDIHPSAGLCTRLSHYARHLCLPCHWHHGFALFIRSQKSLRIEQERQLLLNTTIWHPYSPIKFYWDVLETVLTFVVLLYMPLKVFMDCPQATDPFILFCDFMAFAGVLLRFRTGFTDQKHVVLEPKKIAINYIKGTFILDLIAALPLQLVLMRVENCTIPIHPSMFMLKLLRLINFNRNLDSLYDQFKLQFSNIVVVSTIIKTILFFHWNVFLNFQVPNLYLHYKVNQGFPIKKNQWLGRFVKVIAELGTAFRKYTKNAYIFCRLCFGNGFFGNSKAKYIPKVIFCLRALQGLAGLLFMTYISVSLFRIAVYVNRPLFMYNGKLRELEKYMLYKRLPQKLQKKILNFINYKFSQNYFNEKMILQTLNDEAKHQINMYSCKRLVAKVPLFDDMPVALINCIVFNLTPITFMPGEIVIESGRPGKSMYIISSGTVAVFNERGQEINHLIDGAYFGAQTLLNPNTSHKHTIITLEISEMFKLSNTDLQTCLLSFPHLKRRLNLYKRNSNISAF